MESDKEETNEGIDNEKNKKDEVNGVDRLSTEAGGEWGGRRKAPPPPGTCPGVAWQRKQVRGAGHMKVVRVKQTKFDCAR